MSQDDPEQPPAESEQPPAGSEQPPAEDEPEQPPTGDKAESPRRQDKPEGPRPRGMNPDRLRDNKAFNAKWYACIELAPDMFTPGRERKAVAQTRDLLKRTDIEGGGADGGPARCLDLGMQEGLVTTLLARRGVPKVVGYDRPCAKAASISSSARSA